MNKILYFATNKNKKNKKNHIPFSKKISLKKSILGKGVWYLYKQKKSYKAAKLN